MVWVGVAVGVSPVVTVWVADSDWEPVDDVDCDGVWVTEAVPVCELVATWEYVDDWVCEGDCV